MSRNNRREPCSAAVSRNKLYGCSVSGCTRHRIGLSNWCARHRANAVRYGGPQARGLRKSEYASFEARVRKLYTVNDQHLGFVAAVQWFAEQESRACANADALGRDVWVRLRSNGIPARDQLIAAAAIYCLSVDQPHTVPAGPVLAAAISRAISALSPLSTRRGGAKFQPRRVPMKHSSVKGIGARVLAVLGPFLANTALALEQQQDVKRSLAEALRAPLAQPVGVLVDTQQADQ